MRVSEFWDRRYAAEDYAYGTEPNAFLVSQAGLLRRGMRCLAVGDGEGRNGVWLAEQGMEVTSVDSSSVGLGKARALAASRGVHVRTECVDLFTWSWPQQAFDCVVAIFVHFPPEHRARLHRAMWEALVPGGLVIMEAFTPDQLQYKSGGPPVREMLYTLDTLKADFPDGRRLLLEEQTTELSEGTYHRGTAAVVRLVVQK
jgi:2-polyprenyl-3-methyl-5-hydroxy-6-metoxy-1,4-benzoquinol methylase